jgi:RNA polymerase sigma factor for flagellar operon FliA
MMVSLDSTVETNDEEASFHELLPDENQVEPSEMVEEEELKARLIQALSALSEREQQVLAMYYYEDLTFKEIGEVLSVSESRICQIHGRALMNLRAFMAHSSENPHSLPQAFPVKSASLAAQR